jgi:hypothetical protein
MINMKVKRNISRTEKYRQYITTLNRMRHIAAMSEKRRKNIDAVFAAYDEVQKEEVY